jgi:PAS domain S-box-containing protein
MCTDGESCEFSRAAEQSADPILITDLDGQIEYINPALERLAGISKEKVLGESLRILSPETHDERFYQELWQTLKNGKRFRAEWINKTKDGRECAMDLTIGPVRDAQGHIARVVATGKDITESKRILEELIQSEKRYRHLLDAMPDCIFTINPDAMIQSLNKAFETLTGWQRSQWIGKKFTDMLHPDDRPQALEGFQDVLQGVRLEPVQFRVLTRFGQYLVGEFSCSAMIRKEDIVGLVGVGRDMSSRMKDEQLQRVSEERYRALAEAAQDFIFVVNRDDAVEYINDYGARQLGRGIAALTNQRRDAVFPPEFAARLHSGMRFVFQTREGTQLETKGIFHSAEVFLSLSLVPLLDDTTGSVRAVLGVARDITKQKQLEERVSLLLRDKESLLREIHHRVKNSLQVVSSLLHMEMYRLSAPSDQEIFREMQNRIKAMTLVHEELLESDRFSVSDFGSAIRRMVTHLRRSFGKRNVAVEFLFQEAKLPIYLAVPAAMILCELVCDALQHAFPGDSLGAITIGFQMLPDDGYQLMVAHDRVGSQRVRENDSSQGSLELDLVNLLVNQIGGSIVTENKHGVKHTIVFGRAENALISLLQTNQQENVA